MAAEVAMRSAARYGHDELYAYYADAMKRGAG